MKYKKPKKPGEFLRKVNAKKHKSLSGGSLYPKGNPSYFPQSRTLGAGYGASGRNTLQGQTQTIQGGASAMPAVPGIMHAKKHPAKRKKHRKNWIAKAIKHPGALHRQLGVKAGRKIPAKTLARAAGKGGKLGARARLAETLKGLHKKKGGKHSIHHKKGTMCKGC